MKAWLIRQKKLKRVYITTSVPTTSLIILNLSGRHTLPITKAELNVRGRSNKIATDNGASEY
jgi:hypothetical protein